jgi:uncharacterized membrane protein YoaK (UPF0700 family)
MWPTTEVLRFAAAVVAGLLAKVLLRGHRREPSALASVLLLVAAMSHLVFAAAPQAWLTATDPAPGPVARAGRAAGLEVIFTGSAAEALAEDVHSLAVLALVLGVAFLCLRIATEVLRAHTTNHPP